MSDSSVNKPAIPHALLWRKLMKAIVIIATTLVILFTGVCTLAVWILTPPRLTPLIERVANDNINGNLSLGRVELTFWQTFPHLTVQIDSLTLVSHAFRVLPESMRSSLPADADTVLQVRSFKGNINLLALSAAKVSLGDVAISSPKANIVQLTDTLSNLAIFPTNDVSEKNSDSPMFFSSLSINSFSITDTARFRYRNLPDTLDVGVTIANLHLNGQGAPIYSIATEGSLNLPTLVPYNLSDITFGALGDVRWNFSHPMQVGFSSLEIRLDEIVTRLSGEFDMAGEPTLNRLSISMPDMEVEQLLRHLPPLSAPYVEPLRTNMKCSLSAELAAPYVLTDSILPTIRTSIDIPACDVEYQKMRFTGVEVNLDAYVCGSDPDSSMVTLRRFHAAGRSVEVSLSGEIRNPFTDPFIKGHFNGKVNFASLPPKLMDALPATLTGTLQGKADFKLHASDLSRENFHRMYATGELTVENFRAQMKKPEDGGVQLGRAILSFGSGNKFVRGTHSIDSLLTVSLKIDTMATSLGGMNLTLRDFKAGAGTANRTSSADTTSINPFGFRASVGRLLLDSPADTLRLRLTDAAIGGSVRRYHDATRVPQLRLTASGHRLAFGQALTRVSLRDALLDLNIHLRERKVPSGVDSLALERRRAFHRHMADSLRRNPASPNGTSAAEILTFEMDSTERTLLRRWNFSGEVRAASGRFITPYLPLRNQISNIDLSFNQDSVRLRDLYVKAGSSDFLINGTINNLRRALIGRRNNTLGVTLALESDTLNINELVQAMLSGSALAERVDSAMVWNDTAGDELQSERMAEMADTTAVGALLVPSNINASFSLAGKNVIYSDLPMHDFAGALQVTGGAVRLNNLHASTGIGSISVDGLYSAPDTTSMEFGLGMKVHNFRLDRLSSIVPAIDSLLPAMTNFAGIVNSDIAVATAVTPRMDIDMPTLRAAIKISGDSLVLIDPETFRSLSKWLMFKDKQHNVIKHMDVEVVIENSTIELYPFMFDIDRYRLGVMGSNDMAMNLNYHVSVLKSPIPFKFGINIKGTPDDMKIRLGGAKVKPDMVGERQAIADNTRVNIVRELEALLRRGVQQAARGGGKHNTLNRNLLNGSSESEAGILLGEKEAREADAASIKEKFP